MTRGEEIQFKGDKFKPYWINRDDSRVKKMKTLLNSETYSVGTNEDATDELDQLVGNTEFQYPKPVSLIEALVLAGTHGKKDSIVLDFFAGSGTTLHAVANANLFDGGSRRCILVTNDEGGICRKVTQPRVNAVLSGNWAKASRDALSGSMRFYTTAFMKRHKNPDRMRTDVAAHTIELVAVREFATEVKRVNDDISIIYGAGRSVAVVPAIDADHEATRTQAEKEVREGDERHAYLFTWSDQGIEPEIAALWPDWEVQPLPAEMLAELRSLAPTRTLFDDAEVVL